MTNVIVARYEYPEGATISITVQVEESWPDGLNEARIQAVRGLHEAMSDDMVGTELDDEDDD